MSDAGAGDPGFAHGRNAGIAGGLSSCLGWGGGGNKIGKLLLEIFQLAHKPVIFGVGNNRIVEDVIAVVVEVDLFPEVGDFVFRLGFVHIKIP